MTATPQDESEEGDFATYTAKVDEDAAELADYIAEQKKHEFRDSTLPAAIIGAFILFAGITYFLS